MKILIALAGSAIIGIGFIYAITWIAWLGYLILSCMLIYTAIVNLPNLIKAQGKKPQKNLRNSTSDT